MNAGPPAAPQRPHVRRIHGTETDDPWYWLRDVDDPAVLACLAAENAYADHATAHLAGLRATLFAELRGRIEESHDGLAIPNGPWEYFTRTRAGLQYPIHLRRPR
ncbi:MAG TPA: oligopeptidase B, partial [Acidimicrobiaceae bacterium]|nr:oligopeptidase B [Acidimicrobiaceae bacterium]